MEVKLTQNLNESNVSNISEPIEIPPPLKPTKLALKSWVKKANMRKHKTKRYRMRLQKRTARKHKNGPTVSQIAESFVNSLLNPLQGLLLLCLSLISRHYYSQVTKTIYCNSITVLSLIHISEPTRLRRISYAVFCLKKKSD